MLKLRNVHALSVPILLTSCNQSKGPASEEVFIECDLGEFYFHDGTGSQNGELCLRSAENVYGDVAVEVLHYRNGWGLYAEVDLAEACDGVLCNVAPSSLCVSEAQFWATGDGWSYAVCRTEAYDVTFWKMKDGGTAWEYMDQLSRELVCE